METSGFSDEQLAVRDAIFKICMAFFLTLCYLN
jgi:hypothetical protein